jgi:hypothetical protein
VPAFVALAQKICKVEKGDAKVLHVDVVQLSWSVSPPLLSRDLAGWDTTLG